MYYLLLLFFYPISILPFWALYGISDVMYLVVYKLFGYRKTVVMENLTKSFPEKSSIELDAIAKKFYKNLCDSIVETIKLLTISNAAINKRFTCNYELVNEITGKGQIVQAHLTHTFNWEWGTVASNLNMNVTFTALYNRITNDGFNKLMYKMRTRSGSNMVDMNDMQSVMGAYQKQDICWCFIADQNPSEPRRGAWVEFFGRETSFFKGAELIARRYNNIVLFGSMKKIRRGYYHLEMIKKYDNARDTSDGEITTAYVRYLENEIRQQPENWVWSHRRWKHARVKS